MVEAIHKEECSAYKNFGKGNCECCLDAYECEKITFAIKESNRKPIAKLSDSPGKQMCKSPEHLRNLHHILDIPNREIKC